MLQEAGGLPAERLSASENHVQELEVKYAKQFGDPDHARLMVSGAGTFIHNFL